MLIISYWNLLTMPLHEGCLDLISLGAYDSIVPNVDSELFDLAMVRVWLHALDLDLSGGLKRTKITVDQDALRTLRLACKKDLYTLVLSHGSADSLMTSGELFYLCVNRYFHAEGGKAVKEFRMPLGTVVRRVGARGKTKVATIGSGFHPDLFVNSLFLCIAAAHGVDASVSWVPIFVLRKYMAPAMKNMRQRQVKYVATLMALGPGYAFGDVFYAGLLTLYLCGLIRGDIGRIFFLVSLPGGGIIHGIAGLILLPSSWVFGWMGMLIAWATSLVFLVGFLLLWPFIVGWLNVLWPDLISMA